MKRKSYKSVLRLIMLFAVTAVIFAFAACTPKKGNAPVFSLDKSSIVLTAGENAEELTLTIANVNEIPVWSSTDADVAAVTVGSAANRATVKGVKEGIATIVVTAGELTEVCAVTVKAGVQLELLTKSLDLLVGRSGFINADVTPVGTPVTYRSSNNSVATVNDEGLVTGVSGGVAYITVSAGSKSETCRVAVTAPNVTITNPANRDEVIQLLLEDGKNTYQLEAQSNGEIRWTAGNSAIATVDENGLVTAQSTGTTTVTASYGSAQDMRTVKVKDEIITVTLNKTEQTIQTDGSFTLSATVTSSAGNPVEDNGVKWEVTEGGDIVSVDQNGKVTALGDAYGTATVRATSKHDADAFAECKITVPDPYGDWVSIRNKTDLLNALKAENANKNMRLMADIDMQGAQLNSTLGGYQGTFNGRGYEISNFSGRLFENLSGTVQNTVFRYTSKVANEGICHHVNAGGVIKNCLIDVTFGVDVAAGIGCFVAGAVENTVILARNTQNFGQAYAGTTQNNMGNSQNVFYAVYAGNVMAGGVTLKTDEELKQTSTYGESWEESWIITEGELPVLINENNEPLRIKLNKTAEELFVGEDLTVKATVTPSRLSEEERAVSWTSSNPQVAAVENGVVTALKAGTAIISATSADGTVTATCTVTVKDIEISITGKISELKLGATRQLGCTVSRGGVIWSSSDDTVATVDENGLVTATGSGTVIITVTSLADGTRKDSITIEVKDTIVITVQLSETAINLGVGQSIKLTATLTNSDQGVIWSVEEGTAVTVDPDTGLITAQSSAGTATIRATAKDDGGTGTPAYAECTVTVYVPAVELSIDTAKRTLKAGETSAASVLHVTIDEPLANPSAEDIVWTSSNNTVISTITAGYSDGAYTATLVADNEGYTVITATYTADGIDYKITCEVAVFEASGAWTAVYDLNTFKAVWSGNGNYYLAHDLDLGGATVNTGNRGGYTGKFDGRGFTVSNFTTNAFFMYPDTGCSIENLKLVCTLNNNASNEGIFGHHIIGGTIRNCYFDITFGETLSAVSPALANHIAGGTIENIIVVTHNPQGTAGTYADFFQTDNSVKDMICYRADGNIGSPRKGTDVTENQFKDSATYNSSWEDNWIITDGELPELMLKGFPQAHRHSYAKEWAMDGANHWHAATCEHKDEVKDLGAHDEDGLEGECSVCGHFPEGMHRHTFAEEWSTDTENHWKVTTCEDHDEENGLLEAHNTNGVQKSCSVCGYTAPRSYELTHGFESNMKSDEWIFWKGDNAEEAAKTCGGTYENGTLTVTFSENDGGWWGTQLFYKDSAVTNHAGAKITMTITSTAGGHITVNGQVITLKAGEEKTITVNGAGGNALISIQMGVAAGDVVDIEDATITIKNIKITQ